MGHENSKTAKCQDRRYENDEIARKGMLQNSKEVLHIICSLVTEIIYK